MPSLRGPRPPPQPVPDARAQAMGASEPKWGKAEAAAKGVLELGDDQGSLLGSLSSLEEDIRRCAAFPAVRPAAPC